MKPSILFLWLAGSIVSAWAADDLREELKKVPYQIVFETYRGDNWELYQINADGSQPVNLTQTPKVHEMFPQVSPDGRKIAFIVDEEESDGKVRSVWFMNRDGTDRKLVAKHARWPFWNRTGTALCFIPDEKEQFNIRDPAGKGLCVYDLATGRVTPHPNPGLEHLYNLCFTRNEQWILGTVSGAMGYNHAILALAAQGTNVFRVNYDNGNRIGGCRPDISPDGKRVAWNSSDYTISVADLEITGSEAKVTNARFVVSSADPVEVYQADWSPDGRYLAFTRGPKSEKKLDIARAIISVKAPGWNICVADANGTNRFVEVTTDGNSNKEPDWALPARK
jgi:Tol biopolymer transport system component